MLLFLLPLQIIHWSRLSGKRARQFVVTNVVLNSVMAGLGLLSVFLTPIWILGLVALIFTAYVIRETLNYAGHSEYVDL
jgi:tellurite resistance protein TehA-like permease